MRRHRLTLLLHTHAANSQGSIETMKLPFLRFSGPPLPDLTPAADVGSVMMMLRVVLPPQTTKPHTFLTAYMKNYIMYNSAHQNLGRP